MLPTLLLANVLAPYVAWGVGNDAGLSLAFSMLATTFAAVVERPFYKAAGIGRNSFRHSMQANVLSWLVGLTIAYVSLMCRLDAIFFLMCIIAVPFSIAIEGCYLSSLSKFSKRVNLKWSRIVGGNVLSGLLLFGIRIVGFECGDRMQRAGSPLVLFLAQNKEIIHWSVGAGCVLLFCLFCLPLVQEHREKDLEPKKLVKDAT